MRAALLLLVVAVAAQGALAAGKTPQAQPTAKAPSKAAAPTAKPAASKGKVGVRQQGDEYVDPAVLKEVFTSASPPTGEERAEEPISQEFICSVFGGPSCPEEQPNNVPCLCDSDEACQCVPYYQCDKNTGSVNQFGVGVIDIRQGNSSCPHYIYKCCKPSGPSKTPTDTYPEEPRPPQTESSYKPTDSFTEAPYQPPENHPNPPDYNPNPNPPDYNPNPTDNHNPSPPDNNYNPETPSNGLPPSPPGRPRCGQRNPEGIGVRITGDEDGEAQFGEFPWMVAILKVETSDDEKKRNLYQCGGALITPQVVLTAAHCVKNRISSEQLKVRAGEWDTQTSKEMYRHQDVGVEEVVVHPDYYAGAVHNDIALLFLSEAVHIGYHIGTICMPEQDQNFDYNKCFVSGWGKDTFGQQGRYQVILKKLELPVVPNDQCQEQLRKTRLGNFFVLHHSFICAGGEEGKDTCKGDGGSPLVCPMPGEPGRYQLAGTVAWGIDCGLAGVPGVYGNVPLFRNWVDDQLRMHNIDDTPYLP